MASARGRLLVLTAVALLAAACSGMPMFLPPPDAAGRPSPSVAASGPETPVMLRGGGERSAAPPAFTVVPGGTPRTATATSQSTTRPTTGTALPSTVPPRGSVVAGVAPATPTPRAACPAIRPASVAFVTPAADRPSAELQQLLVAALAGRPGNFGLAVKHLSTGEWAAVNGSRIYEAASLYKLNLLYGVYALAGRGASLSDVITISEKAAYFYEDGEPSLLPGETTTVADAVRCAITVSDNTSAHALLEYLPIWQVNDTLRRLGLQDTEINQGTRTSPLDMLRLLELIAAGRAVSPEASRAMLELLLAQQINDRLPRLLPEGVAVAHKTGNLPGLRHDVGIVYGPAGAYVICALVDGLPDPSPEHPDPGSRDIAEVSRLVYDYFAQRSPAR